MKPWAHKLEVIVDRVIPYMLVLLLVIIVLEIFFADLVKPYHYLIEIADALVILTFAVDLYFKYMRVRNIPRFLKKYWLDIIAIFPFFLIFRLVEEIILFSTAAQEGFLTGQKVLHEGVEAEKVGSKVVEVASREGAKIVKEAEIVAKFSRTGRFANILKVVFRPLRFTKYFSKDTRKEMKDELRKDEKFIIKEKRKVKKVIIKDEKWLMDEFKHIRRPITASVFYEKPTGKHHVHEKH